MGVHLMKRFLFITFLMLPPSLAIIGWSLKWFSPGWTDALGGLNNLATVAMAILTYYYVVLTGYYVGLTGDLVRQALRSQGLALQAQEAEFRPYMVVDIEFEEVSGFLVIKNVGRLPALNVRIKFEPQIVATSDGAQYNLTEGLLSEPFSVFPPGKIQRSDLGPAEEFLDPNRDWVYHVSLSYTWPGRRDVVSENYVINLNFEKHVGWQKKRGLEEVVETLEKIERRLREVSLPSGQ